MPGRIHPELAGLNKWRIGRLLAALGTASSIAAVLASFHPRWAFMHPGRIQSKGF